METAELNRIVTERLERLRADIVSAIENKGIKASGRTQDSLRVVPYDGGVMLIAGAGERAPIPTLEIGRAGGRVPKNFTDIIVEWSRDKGLDWGDDKQRRRIAGAVAWGKIAKVGTDRHAQNVDVYSTLVEQAAADVSGYIMTTVTEQIKSNF